MNYPKLNSAKDIIKIADRVKKIIFEKQVKNSKQVIDHSIFPTIVEKEAEGYKGKNESEEDVNSEFNEEDEECCQSEAEDNENSLHNKSQDMENGEENQEENEAFQEEEECSTYEENNENQQDSEENKVTEE